MATKSLKARGAAALTSMRTLQTAVYSHSQSREHRLSEIRTYAPAELVVRYDAACDLLTELEAQAVSGGKAFRTVTGGVMWN